MNGEKSHISGINKTIKFLKQSKNKKNQIVYCPPFTLISSVKNKVKNTKIKVGAQNLSQLNDYGAFTGSINSKLIKSAGGDYVIVGHSEIRNQENDIIINKKIHSALNKNLKVIFCIGETLIEKRKKITFSVLKRQINKGLKSIKNFNNILIAYEPVWSIGTGVIPKDKELKLNVSKIKRIISKKTRYKLSNISKLRRL